MRGSSCGLQKRNDGSNSVRGFRQMVMESPHSIIMAALSSLPSPDLSRLSRSISALLRRRLRRLSHLLISPALLSLTLLRLQSLSLHHKSLLLAHHLLSNLTLLLHFIRSNTTNAPRVKLRELDSALLLLLLCEVHHHDPHLLDALPPSRWRIALRDYVAGSILRVSSLGGGDLLQFVESVGRCWNLVEAMCCRRGGGKEEEIAASAAAVVALPSVEVRDGDGRECVICKEELREGREACELPCHHLFHWACILRWLGKRNSCPCCRRRLPTDDVRREIERLWDDLAEIGGG